MTCAELTAMSPSEVDAMTKADIISEIFEGVTRSSATLTQENGENTLLEESTTDAYRVLVGTRAVEWTYYLTGEVDEITVTERDADEHITSQYAVKHYTDGREPRLTTLA